MSEFIFKKAGELRGILIISIYHLTSSLGVK